MVPEVLSKGNVPDYKLKFNRAIEHYEAIKKEISTWLSSNPIVVVKSHEDGGRRHTVRIDVLETPKVREWATLIGDLVHNLRSALNSLVYLIAVNESGQDPPPKQLSLQFPISATAEQFQKQKSFIGTLSLAAQLEIEQLQPYRQPTPTLRLPARLLTQVQENVPHALILVGELDNQDKHRMLNRIAWNQSQASLKWTGAYKPELEPLFFRNVEEVASGEQILSFTLDRPCKTSDYKVNVSLMASIRHLPAKNGNKISELLLVLDLMIAEVEAVINRLEAHACVGTRRVESSR